MSSEVWNNTDGDLLTYEEWRSTYPQARHRRPQIVRNRYQTYALLWKRRHHPIPSPDFGQLFEGPLLKFEDWLSRFPGAAYTRGLEESHLKRSEVLARSRYNTYRAAWVLANGEEDSESD